MWKPRIAEFLYFQAVDEWTCDVLEVDKASGEHALRFIGYEIFNKYEITDKFNVWIFEQLIPDLYLLYKVVQETKGSTTLKKRWLKLILV